MRFPFSLENVVPLPPWCVNEFHLRSSSHWRSVDMVGEVGEVGDLATIGASLAFVQAIIFAGVGNLRVMDPCRR